MTKVEYRVELRYPDGNWLPAGGWFDHYPDDSEARDVGYRSAGLRSKGSPLPEEVRVVTVTHESGRPIPFKETSSVGPRPPEVSDE